MNAHELLKCAPRLSESNRAYVILDNDDRGIIVPPGASGKGAGDAASKPERVSWSKAEDETILRGVSELGHKWRRIAERLPGRTFQAPVDFNRTVALSLTDASNTSLLVHVVRH